MYFFLGTKLFFLEFIFIVSTGGNQHSFCDVLINNFGSYMTENYFFKICRKCNDKYYIIYFVSKEHGFLDIYMSLTFLYLEEESPVSYFKNSEEFSNETWTV